MCVCVCVCTCVCTCGGGERRLQISGADIRAEKLEAAFNTCLHKGVISEAAAAQRGENLFNGRLR